MLESGVSQDRCKICGVILNGPDYAADTGMRPNDRRVGVTFQERLHLFEVCRRRAFFGEWNIDIVVNQHNQPNFGGEVENTVQSGILKACHLTSYLRGYELLMNRKFPDAGKDTGKRLQHAANMVRRIHVRGIETGDHGVKTGLLVL